MPLWDSPPRTLKTLLERMRSDGRGIGGKRQIKLATVQAVREDRLYVVDGVAIPTTGYDPSLRAGERVYVLYVDDMPIVILRHLVRRAQFGVDIAPPTGGVIEQLFVVQDPSAGNAWDVFFRNYSVCKPLGARKLLTGNESLNGAFVIWGPNGRYFATRCVPTGVASRPVYTIWKLDRTPNKILNVNQVPKVTKIVTYDFNTDVTTIASMDPHFVNVPGKGFMLGVSPWEWPFSMSLSSGPFQKWNNDYVTYLNAMVAADAFTDPAFCLDDHDPPHLIVSLGLDVRLNIQWFDPSSADPSYLAWRMQVSLHWTWVYDVTTHTALLTDFPTGGNVASLVGSGGYCDPTAVPNWWDAPTTHQPFGSNVFAFGKLAGNFLLPLSVTQQKVTAFVLIWDQVLQEGPPNYQTAAVWLRDGVIVLTPRPYGATTQQLSSTHPAVGDRHHVLWSYPLSDTDANPAPYRLSSLDTMTTKALGSTTADFYTVDAQNLLPLPVDYLWKAVPTKLAPANSKQYFFVNGWKWPEGAPTLDITAKDYPAEDTALKNVKALAAFPTGVSDLPRFGGIVTYRQANAFRVVSDSAVLSPLDRYLSS